MDNKKKININLKILNKTFLFFVTHGLCPSYRTTCYWWQKNRALFIGLLIFSNHDTDQILCVILMK